MKRYTPELEAEMRAFYQSLSETGRRRYAAIESRKLGYGGHSYIATVLPLRAPYGRHRDGGVARSHRA